MKKLLLVLVCLFGLVGCAGNKTNDFKADNNKMRKTSTIESKSPEVIDGLEITVSNLSEKISVNKNGKRQKLYIFEVVAKNIGQDVKGLGAIDFVMVTDKNRAYSIDIETPAFGGEVQPSETTSGKMYFSVPVNEKVSKIKYQPEKKVLETWKIK